MTVEQLKEETKTLEQALKELLRTFEEVTGCRVVEVKVKEEGDAVHDIEVEIRLDPLPYPQRLPKAQAY